MPWPLSQDYNEAIQTPAQCFADTELQRGEAVTNNLGLPVPCSGNFADVYAVVSGSHKWAVKCFTRQIPGLRERYTEISKYLPQVQLPFMVEFKFLEQGIRVRGQWYPILKMQWVEGQTLNAFVRANLENPAILQSISQIWVKLAARLREATLAHGDLQHGNVLLVQGPKAGTAGIKLVDYDGMCVPALELLKATEVGHPAYQHPQRLREATYGLHIDNFSHLVIYTALRALAVGGRKLWERYDNGDNLLFVQRDFEAPSQSPVFRELLAQSDGEVRKLATALAEAARLPVQQAPLLENVLPSGSRPKTAIPKPAALKPADPNPIAHSTTPTRLRQNRGSRHLVAAVLMGCLVLAGIGLGAFIVWPSPSPTSPVAAGSSRRTEKVTTPANPTTSTTTKQTTNNCTLVLEIEPEQAELYLDGKLVSLVSPKEVSLEVSADKHELKVTKSGFKEHKETWDVAGSAVRRLRIKLEPDTVANAPKVTFTPLDIKGVATVASNRIFNQESLLFPQWGSHTYQGVPFTVVDPENGKTKNTVCLYSGRGAISAKMPRSVRLACNAPAKEIHFLGATGWGVPWTKKGTVSMVVKLEYAGGGQEDHELINGVHFADWAKGPDVPQSKGIGVLQVRHYSVVPKRPTEALKAIEFHKGTDQTSPFVMAVTIETSP